MSPLVLLGALGTLSSTLVMIPHLLHARRTRRPAGSATGWLLGAGSSLVWVAYGLASGDPLVGAPGLVSIPVNTWLGVWCWREATRVRPVPVSEPQHVLAA